MKPPWLKKKISFGSTYFNVQTILKKSKLNTVCMESLCPNRGDCYSQGTATFLILGDRCTRTCRFCSISHGPPKPIDPLEPLRVAETTGCLNLNYVVITSVTRDDLPDGGAKHFAETIREIKAKSPQACVEVLIPDFQGSYEALRVVVEAKPNVLGHNIETVPRLYSTIRPGADYFGSLKLLKHIRELDDNVFTKSGIMLGLGETPDEITKVLADLFAVECSILTIGQYLQPHENSFPVQRYIAPEEFIQWQNIAHDMGLSEVVAGPFVRSSYNAEDIYESIKRKKTMLSGLINSCLI
ncbi:lipoyl synthase [Candidatus Latescibacterota bacterium]